MVKIYHNNRCSKSRNAIKFLEKSNVEFEIIKYLEDVPSKKELQDLIKLLGITPIELVRKNEMIWKESYKYKNLTDSEIINTMIDHPKLIERPIIINGNKAVIGRPTEIISKII